MTVMDCGIPRPEYPRPQFVRDRWLNLNGEWAFERDPGLSGQERGLPAAENLGGRIVVPFCPESELSGVGDRDFLPCAWYSREFRIPDGWSHDRILLHFGAVDYAATVWVNGEKAGEHLGGYSPFTFDITRLVGGGQNRLVVRAVDDTRSPLQPSGKQSLALESAGCTYTRTTGIWQTVWLEPVPRAASIDGFRLFPEPDDGSLTVHTRISGGSGNMALRVRAFADGVEVGEQSCLIAGQGVLTLRLSDVRLWRPGEPFLYDLELSLEVGGVPVDVVRSYFGLRSIAIDGKRILINGQPVFQRMVLDQGFYPDGIYTAPNDEALRRDIELSLAMGFNGARLHQKVFEPRFLYWADRLGYIAWGEYPNWGIDAANPAVLKRVLQEWLEVLERDFNHPSIVGWCPFNETLGLNAESGIPDRDLLRTVYRVTKSIDQTRPVIDSSAYIHVETDVYDCHNAEQDPEKLAAAFEPFRTGEDAWRNYPELNAPYAGQPYFVSEYGGTGWNPGEARGRGWGYGEDPKTEGEFLERYRALTEVLLFHPKMFGFCYIQLYDVEQEMNGLYTYQRVPKFDPEVIRQINSQEAAIEKSDREGCCGG